MAGCVTGHFKCVMAFQHFPICALFVRPSRLRRHVLQLEEGFHHQDLCLKSEEKKSKLGAGICCASQNRLVHHGNEME